MLGRVTGGLSGPSLKPVALAAVHACYAATKLPIVGMGGIESGADVVEFVACGAKDVALGTILFSDPDACARIRDELAPLHLDDVFAIAHSPRTVESGSRVPA